MLFGLNRAFQRAPAKVHRSTRSWPGGLFRGCNRLFPAILALAANTGALAQGVEVAELDLEAWCQRQLGNSMSAIAAELVANPEIVAPELMLAYGLAEIATETSPDSEAAWRRLYELGTLLHNNVPDAAEARRRAIQAILRFDPDDPVMRLRLLLDRIEGRPTAAARIEGYERLLAPGNIEKLGNPTAARLAFDLALLQMRVGDQAAGVENVVRALEFDPTFPAAADMAAGLFRATVDNPIDEAELLAIAWSASPLDAVVARALAQLVLRAGDYTNAAEILDLALLITPDDARFRSILVADLALALWGDGRPEAALDALERGDRDRTVRIKQEMLAAGDDPFDVEALLVPPAPEAALVEAAIIARTGTRLDRDAAIETLFAAFEFELSRLATEASVVEADTTLDEATRSGIDADVRAARARLVLDEAWARAWFGWQPDLDENRSSLEELLDQADELGSLQDEQRAIIEGWWAIHDQEYARARSLLEPAAARSPYALAGMALLEEVEGASKQAARRYLEVYRDRPGDLVGIWCRSRLAALLGVDVPPTNEAKLMAEMLQSTLAPGVGRAIRDPKHGVVAIRIEPKTLRYQAYEPVLLELRVTNVSDIPLAIGPDGPLKPSVAIVFDTVSIVGIMDYLPPEDPLLRPQPLILGVDRVFSIRPQQSVVIEVNLSAAEVAKQIDAASLLGGSFQVRAVSNFVIAPGRGIDAGPFGREAFSPVFRVDGLVPGTMDRTEQMLTRMADASTVSDVKDIASLLAIVTANPRTLPTGGSREELLGTDDGPVRSAVFTAFATLPPVARAWALSTLQRGVTDPNSDVDVNGLIDRVVSDETDFGMAICLARFSPKPASQAIVQGLASADPRIRRMAEAARDLALIEEEREAKAFRLEDG